MDNSGSIGDVDDIEGRMNAAIKRLDERLDRHVAEVHGGLNPGEAEGLIAEHRDMVQRIGLIDEKTDLIVDKIAGECDSLTGQRGPGIASRMRKLEHAANGGGGLSMKRSDKFQIAVITSVTTIAVSVLSIVAAIVFSVVR